MSDALRAQLLSLGAPVAGPSVNSSSADAALLAAAFQEITSHVESSVVADVLPDFLKVYSCFSFCDSYIF
jgi:hypothetical protein